MYVILFPLPFPVSRIGGKYECHSCQLLSEVHLSISFSLLRSISFFPFLYFIPSSLIYLFLKSISLFNSPSSSIYFFLKSISLFNSSSSSIYFFLKSISLFHSVFLHLFISTHVLQTYLIGTSPLFTKWPNHFTLDFLITSYIPLLPSSPHILFSKRYILIAYINIVVSVLSFPSVFMYLLQR